MARKYKTTGCARFFFALLIIVPLAYFGAAYYNGVNGIEQIKEWFGTDSDNTNSKEEEKTKKDLEDEVEKLRKENEELKKNQK